MSWLAAFGLTLLIELPIVAWLAGRERWRSALPDAFAANLLTHPVAWWLVHSALWPWGVVELGVFAVEALIYRGVTGMSWPRAIGTAAAANGVTAALSLVL